MIVVLQDRPLLVVQFNALDVVLQLGTAIAVGDAANPAGFATIVLADCVARVAKETEEEGRLTVPDAVKFVKDPVDPLIGVPVMLDADKVVKEPDEPLTGVPVNPVALIPPVKVAPVSGA